MGAGDDHQLGAGLGDALVERIAKGEGLGVDVDNLDRVAPGNRHRAIRRAGVDQDHFDILDGLLLDAVQQAANMLLFIEGADHDRASGWRTQFVYQSLSFS